MKSATRASFIDAVKIKNKNTGWNIPGTEFVQYNVEYGLRES
jgi:hypothetical protein